MKILFFIVGASLFLGACSAAQPQSDSSSNQETTASTATTADSIGQDSGMESEATMNIVETAIDAGNFTTLVKAVQAAGLVETLSGPGPYTVFAPNDDAFAKVDAETLNALLADPEQLTAVLTYHVVPGQVMAEDVDGLTSATTVQGSSIKINTSNGVMVNDANVIATDIETTNGVIHVIDSVLLPPTE
jgi:uncharacterized surface protein with fasciclin (FAS1) repeats